MASLCVCVCVCVCVCEGHVCVMRVVCTIVCVEGRFWIAASSCFPKASSALITHTLVSFQVDAADSQVVARAGEPRQVLQSLAIGMYCLCGVCICAFSRIIKIFSRIAVYLFTPVAIGQCSS